MDGQRRIPRSLATRRRLALRWLATREPGIAARRCARIGAVGLLATSIGWGLVVGGHLNGETRNGLTSAEHIGFSAENITVQGLTHHQPEDVLTAIGMQAGQSLVWFSAMQAKENIEKLSWVQSATVERRMPNQLIIAVSERTPYAVWQKGNEYTVIDRAGIAMGDIAIDSLKGLPMITGEGANLAAPALLEALQATPEIQIRMQGAARIGNRRWNIYLDDGLKILLPENNVRRSLEQLAQVDVDTGLLSKGILAVDLRDPAKLIVTTVDVPEEGDKTLLTGSTAKVKP
jgi:cell division protein FtsQ